MSTILALLGYPAAFAYDKVREVWRLDGVEICLDSLPFGDADELCPVVEIEGVDAGIADVSEKLGLLQEQASAANYHDLNRAWRAERGLVPGEDFVFSPAALEKIRADLGLAATE